MAALTVAALAAGCGMAAPQGSGAPRLAGSSGPAGHAGAGRAYNVSGLRNPRTGKLIGVETAGPAGSLGQVRAFAASTGRRPNIVGEYVGWRVPFDAAAAAATWTYGALPFLVWEPYGTTLRAVAAGQSDAYVRAFARSVRALNIPVAISFAHEMNGNWYPWGVPGATAAQFVAAWRHIHGLFASAGATNVIWVWNPNTIDALPQVRLRPYYPGDGYVDWVGITGYFTPSTPADFAGLFGPTLRQIRAFTARPVIIPETSVASGPQAVPAVRSLIAAIRQRPDVLGLIWFEYDKAGVDWRAESRPPIRQALAASLAGLALLDIALAA